MDTCKYYLWIIREYSQVGCRNYTFLPNMIGLNLHFTGAAISIFDGSTFTQFHLQVFVIMDLINTN